MIRALSLTSGAGADGSVTLTYADRYRRRAVLKSDLGEDILLDLAEATELTPGGTLALEDGRSITVAAAPEPLAEVHAAGATLARLAWHIGNRHTPCQVCEDRLLIQRDHVLEDMLRGLGAEVRHVDTSFQPEGGAYGKGRTHSHAHAHDAHDDPNAHIPHRRHEHDHG